MVYEGFQRQRALAAAQQAQAAQQGGMGGGGVSGGQPSAASGQGLGPATGAASAPPSLTMSQVITYSLTIGEHETKKTSTTPLNMPLIYRINTYRINTPRLTAPFSKPYPNPSLP